MPQPPETPDPHLERASVPLATLLETDRFEAELAVPTAAELEADPALLDRVRAVPVAAPVVIELEDPGDYLTSGDLLLITGLGLPGGPAAVHSYVERLVSAGVGALVFGLEPVYPEVPPLLVRACSAQGLPLVVLPPEVVFAQVVALLTRALEDERTRSLSAMNTTARKLTEAALKRHPAQRILGVLAQAGGWAALRVDGEILQAGQGPIETDPAALFDALEQKLAAQSLARGGTPTAFRTLSERGTDFSVTAHEVTVGAEARGRASGPSTILALGRSPELSRTDRTALLLAANLMRLVVSLPTDQSTAVDQLLMHLLVESAPPASHRREQDRYGNLIASSLLTGRKRRAHAVVAVRPRHDSHSLGVPSDVRWMRRTLRTPLADHRRDRLRAFTARPPSTTAFDQAEELGWYLAVSDAYPVTELPEAMHEAERLAEFARRTEQHQRGYLPDPPDELWLSGETAAGFGAAQRMLAPLDPPEATESRAALAVWLRRNGSWDRTARALGVHRNTVRRLIGEAEQRLGQDLDDPVTRARLLLAFTHLDPE